MKLKKCNDSCREEGGYPPITYIRGGHFSRFHLRSPGNPANPHWERFSSPGDESGDEPELNSPPEESHSKLLLVIRRAFFVS